MIQKGVCTWLSLVLGTFAFPAGLYLAPPFLHSVLGDQDLTAFAIFKIKV
jgi:hypothetical protein